MKSILPLALITFLEGVRHRILFGVVIASLLLIFISILLCGLFMRDLSKVLLDICLSAVSVGGLLVPFFVAINLLAGDIERKTIYTILARPITRGQYIFGRFLGLALLAGSIMAILTGATLLAGFGASKMYPAHFFASYSVQPILISTSATFLGILMLNSTVLLWCSVTTSSFLASLLTLSTYVIGQSVEDLVRFIQVQNASVYISPVVKVVLKGVLYIFPNLGAFDLKQYAAHGLPIAVGELFTLVLYCCAYTIFMLTLATFFFNKRNLP